MNPEAPPLFSTTWLHVFEEDTPAGAVFRPEDADIPLSRRPRQRFELNADGTAVLLMPGPDDRFVAQPATWQETAGGLVVRGASGDVRLTVVERSPDRLVVRLHNQGS